MSQLPQGHIIINKGPEKTPGYLNTNPITLSTGYTIITLAGIIIYRISRGTLKVRITHYICQ